MKRLAFILASLLSLLLCAATVALWVRSYNTFDDVDKISTSLTPTDFTQHYIRLGSNDARFIFTWRDIIWPTYNSSFSQVTSTWDHANGEHFTHKPPYDFEEKARKKPNDRSWELRFGGVWFKRIMQIATPANMPRREPRFDYPGMIGVWIIVPHAYVVALLAILPVIALLKWWRRPRRGGCEKCGYSLTGNVSGVCPECGTAVANKTGATA